MSFLKKIKARYFRILGNLLCQRRLFTQGIQCLTQAITCDSKNKQLYLERGNEYFNQDHFVLAKADFQTCLSLSPEEPEALISLSKLAESESNMLLALTYLECALHQNPQHVVARWNRAIIQLRLGAYTDAWDDYLACYWKLPLIKPYHHFERVLWQGEGLSENTLLIWEIQGIGDTLQWIRYAVLIKEIYQPKAIILECRSELVSLIREADLFDLVIAKGEKLPAFDKQCSTFHLPKNFKTSVETIPATIPYLKSNELRQQYWLAKLNSSAAIKIGIVWAGNPDHRNDRLRSCSAECFEALTTLPDIQWYSLQKGRSLPASSKIIDLSMDLSDFVETAALISQLDLVISVDTAVAHLTGALGKPVWVLLPWVADWRWLQAPRTDSPWYPSARLFRQTRRGDWSDVFNAVKQALLDFTKTDK